MAEERGYGVIEYKGKEYHYIQEGQFLTIPSISFQDIKEFEENEVIDVIHGSTSNYQGIVFLDCKVLMGTHLFLSEVKIRVLGYIILERGKCCFDRIDFYSEAINGFYSPRNAYEIVTKDNHRCFVGIKAIPHKCHNPHYTTGAKKKLWITSEVLSAKAH